MPLMYSNNYKNVKGVKGMLRVQTHTLNTVKASHIKPSQTYVKPVKGFSRVRAREEKNQQSIIKNIFQILFGGVRDDFVYKFAAF